jgi:hypothetical protein
MCQLPENVTRISSQCKLYDCGKQSIDQLHVMRELQKAGLGRELNPGPLAPEAKIIPLDHQAALFAMLEFWTW